MEFSRLRSPFPSQEVLQQGQLGLHWEESLPAEHIGSPPAAGKTCNPRTGGGGEGGQVGKYAEKCVHLGAGLREPCLMPSAVNSEARPSQARQAGRGRRT